MDLGINPIHTTIWVVSFVGLIISIVYIIINKEKTGYGIAALTFFLDVFLYNLALHGKIVWGFDFLTLKQLEIWSGVVRLHSLFLLISFLIIPELVKKR